MLDSIISHQVQYMPDSQLAQEVQNPTGAMPSWMALSELKRRQDLRQGAPVQSPQGTVADSVIKAVAASGMQPQGMGVSSQLQPPGGIMGGAPMSQPTGAGIMASAPPVHMASGGSVGTAVQQPGQGIIDGPAPIDPSVGQTAYQNPNLMSLDQASNAVHGLYGQGADMSPIYQQIADLQAQANHPYGTKEALRDIGMRMMANPTGNILSSIGDATMGATANQKAMQEKALEDNKALLGLRATIQEKQQDRQDKIADNITKYQDTNNQIADGQAKAQNQFALGNTRNALDILTHNQSMDMQQKKLAQDGLKQMADPAQAQAALLQAQALLKDPTVQSDPVKLKKAQDSVDYLTGVINADHSEDARTAGLKQQGELTLEHARAADQMRLESMKEADALKGLTGLAAVDPNAPLSDLQKDSIGQMATSFIQTGALPNIGRTKESAAILQKVVERAAAIRNKLGMTPEEAAQLPANFKANQGSLNNLQKQYGNINSYEQNVEKGIPLLESAYANVSRSNIPLLDKFIFPAESAAGVGGTQALKNAVETTSSEYAKVMAGFGSQTSDSARAHAREVLNEYQSKGQLQQGLTILKKEMANRIGSMSDEIGNTNHRLTLQGLLDSARGKTLVAGVPSQSAGPSSSIDDIKKKHGISY